MSAGTEEDAAYLLRMLLKERGHRTDGNLLDLAARALHLARGDHHLISLRGNIISRLERRHPRDPIPVITHAMWSAGQHAYAMWVHHAHREGKPADEHRVEGIDLAIAAMTAQAGADHG